jgi:hypothetical protein
VQPKRIPLLVDSERNHEDRIERLEQAVYEMRSRVNLVVALLIANGGLLTFVLVKAHQ